jgi:hypothetical protein
MRLALLFVLAACTAPARAERAPTGPVLLEVFTSQGCSSCPPADRVVSDIRADASLSTKILPLAFHVDYWDDLGWKDPLSSAAWTARQQTYASRLGGGVYTPEAVVGGVVQTVGSNRDRIVDLAARADAISAPCLAATEEDGAIVVAASCPAPAGADFWAAVVEDGIVTRVARGENAGRELRSDAVVRALVRVDARVRIPRQKGWGQVGVVGFAQEHEHMRVLSAARLLGR